MAATGNFSNASNAFTCNDVVASASSNNDAESFSTYGLSLPPTAIITGIQVRVRANDGSLNNRKLRISLSSDGGATFTAPLATRNFRRNSPLRDYVVGGSTILWGRTWTAADFADGVFRVRALAPKANGGSPVNLDCIPVTVFYRLPGAPSLNLNKTDGPDPVPPGQDISYTIAYSNTGESTATAVVVSDTVPANTTFVSASPPPSIAPAIGGTGLVAWNVGSLPPGGSGVVTLVVKAGAALPNGTVITNASYSIASDQNTPTAGNPATTTVSGTIALTLSKTDSPDPVAPGGTLTYVLTISNVGTGTSNNIIVNESFDGNVTYVAGSYSSSCPGITESADTDGQWVIPTLASGSPPCTITINTTVATPLADGVLLFNTADIVDAANNAAEASAVTTVLNPVVCGDGIVGAGEACDLGSGLNGSGDSCCTASCQLRAAGETCRAAAGTCDAAEVCDGLNDSCPADQVLPTGTECRASAGACDPSESCDGVGTDCPADERAPSGTVCRASGAGEGCDVPESCDGTNVTCPADAVQPEGTTCRASAGVCDPAETCDGTATTCPADGKSSAPCRAAAGVCDVAESCDGVHDACPPDAFVSDGTNCDDDNYCNGTQSCTDGVCGGGDSPCAMGQSCDEATDRCFVGDCPAAPVVCRTAAKNKVLIKNKADDSRDKLIWKWSKGAATTQTELADPTATAGYALCIYAGATPALLESAQVPPGGGRWSPVGDKGYKYSDAAGSNAGITKIIVKGGNAGKSKALVKGKGAGLPDFNSDLPVAAADLPLIVQLRNNHTGICWEGSFASPKKNQADQFNATAP
ncbi:DUF11 domain-containing protein [bacterium]|nr:DUF11 domain-containing protein [bacterium]